MAAQPAQPTLIDSLLWTATRYSDVLQVNNRIVAQALESIPHQTHNGRRVWHVRDAMPAIYKRVFGVCDDEDKVDPKKLDPVKRFWHYRAEQERRNLERDDRNILDAAEVESVISEAFKSLAQSLDALPDLLERDAALSPESIQIVQAAMDSARESLYAVIMKLGAAE